MIPPWARVDLGVMAIKKYSAFPKALALLEPHHQMYFSVISRPLVGGGGLTPLQRCSRCILQTQPTGQEDKGDKKSERKEGITDLVSLSFIATLVRYLMPNPVYICSAFNKFPDFLYRHLKLW